ncbi:MAG: PAS domain-containing protein, partial [Planctomycetota bacterium]|nr:PAS domain-containing protein [Planctomycetota bacterium]
LSGMGSDGTLGLRAIKEHAGVVLVQDPASAKFDGMPRSAIDAGLADIIAPADKLPGRLLQYLKHAPLLTRTDTPEENGVESQLEKVVILLRSHSGHDFALYKRNTLSRRIERRMGLHHIEGIETYVRYLRENSQELDLLFKELLIGVTSFFRDPLAWDQLRDEALPALLGSHKSGHALRAWVPGCSTGEEAYSLAIVFQEMLDAVKPQGNFSLQIFATDLDRDAVEKARLGFYPLNISADVSPERLDRFFVKEEHGYRVSRKIREQIIFAPQNLIMDPPFTKLDLLSCRNLLIYFTPELQKKLFPLFHYSLNPNGVLFLGSAESIGSFTRLFKPLPGKWRIFCREQSLPRAEMVEFPSAFVSTTLAAQQPTHVAVVTPDRLQALAEQWLLQNHAPAAVLVNPDGDILFVSGRTGRFLEPVAGKANWNVFVMAREGLRYELTSTFQKAHRQTGPATVNRLKIQDNNSFCFVDLTIQVLTEPEALRGLVVILFSESASPQKKPNRRAVKQLPTNERIAELEQALQQSFEDVQSTREEMQTSQEELKSMNEELQSSNEELQSTNEELTTSKEEMQSLNEELHSVNAELRAKVDEMMSSSSDMKNLLNSTEIATVFLDQALRVRRFTEQATNIFQLIPGDVGRPITDLANSLLYPKLATDAREVLRSLVPVEKALATSDGRWFALRLMPYRTLDNRIDGVVITLTDMSIVRKLGANLESLPAPDPRSDKR